MNAKRLLLSLAITVLSAAPAVAQDWPTKPVRILVGFSPGGAADLVGRILQKAMSERLGQPVVVENRTGASGLLATAEVVRATPDGHTLGVIVSTHASSPAIQPNMPFDPVRDVAAVALIGKIPLVIGVHSGVKAQTLQELIALAKSTPGGMNYATAGAGLAHHFAGELFKRQANIVLIHTPYRGAGPMMAAMMGAEIPIGVAAVPTIRQNVESGRLRALAVTSARRAPNMPTVPTVAESGFPGFDISEWYGVVTTAGTPPAIVGRINQEINKIMATPEMTRWVQDNAIIRDQSSAAEFAAFIRSEITKLGQIARDANIKVE
ncbi:MAG: Bug family tripartite tricarboxylate transporter substrate binding protein [bacterium]|jgi:tripartite-type tricarboxylate transporter receptor subunit TctC|nr:tripartite tricarboxylate transporter substrate binding protein [Betaproteobacteria bacterium]